MHLPLNNIGLPVPPSIPILSPPPPPPSNVAATYYANVSNLCTPIPPPPPSYTHSIVERTTNIIELFLHMYCYVPEQTQTPKSYLYWSALTMIAASVQDRFYIEKFKYKRIKPNIYTLLVGPSGLGKDFSIDILKRYVEPHNDVVRLYDGKLTHAYFWDFLADKKKGSTKKNIEKAATALLITPELKHSLGSKGQLADAFIAQMTALYDKEGIANDGSRMWGGSILRDPCITWIGGTTQEWLFETISQQEIAGGYAARVNWIVEDYAVERIRPEPVYPPDFEEVHQYLLARITALVYSPGCEMRLSPEARAWHNEWINEREIPEDQLMLPTFHREPVLVLKLSILFCLADGKTFEISQAHIEQATNCVEELRITHLPKLLYAAGRSPRMLDITHVEAVLRGAPEHTLDRTMLLRRVHSRGMDSTRLSAALMDLQQAGIVEQKVINRIQMFTWKETARAEKRLAKMKRKSIIGFGIGGIK